MKKWKERGKRIAVLLLTAALVGSSVDLSALTVNAAEEEKVLTCEKEEQTTSEEITETAKRITSWTWNDEEEMLDLEENVLALPGASKDYIVSFDDIVSFLPASITATITTSASVTETEDTEATNESEETDGAEETVTLEGWVCENYPEEGAYSGNYTFTANLPEGYELAEDAAALKVNVELGGAQLLEATTITPTQPSEGDGSVENPYQITSAAELYWFAGLVNGTLTDGTQNNSACAKLMNDITVNDNLLKNITYKKDESGNPTNEVTNGENFISWTPIGANGSAYQGTFDGNGKTISGLFFNDSQKSHVGLFDNIYMATIRNVGVVDSYFFGEHYVGGVCAFGVDGTITGSYNTGVVSGEGCVGGVCGTGSSVTITDSYNTGSVSGNDDVGGVFGYGENCTINNCYYLKAEGTDLGGINGADVEGQAEGKTAAQFASGEVAYLLQDGQKVGEDGTIPQVWGQNIDNDGEKQSFPVFSNAKVYKPSESSPCKVGYTNNAEGLKEHDFGDDKTGESCSYCNIKNINYSGISISGVDTPYYYTGNEIKPDITIKKGETSLTLGEDYNITYGNNTDVAGSNAENAPYVKITGKGNYTGEITKNFTIAYITAPDNYITGTKGANDWYTSDVTIGVADWQVSTDGSSWNDSISVTEEGTHSYTLYFKDSNGYITDSKNKEIKIDKAAPTGTIQVKESTWDKFLEKISFGFYTNTKEKITITSEDTGSGIASTEYLVSDKAYTQISDMQNLSGWKDYDNSNKPKIKTNRTNYVYARITDNVGNVTYLSSDGILHDDEIPYIFDITPVMKDRSGSVTFEIFEDGSGLENVYFLYSTDMDKVTSATTENLKASDYHNATGTFTLSDLKPNTEYYCAVLAVDKAGNESYLLNSTFKTLKEAITGTVSISGEAVYGKTLTASYEGLATDAGEVTVSWYRGEDTTAIATGDTYTLTADDVGKVITVKVTAENCSGELTDSTAEVAKAEHPNPPTNGNVDDENNTFTFNGTSGVTYEYSTDGGASWTDITVDSGTGVGTVTVGNVIVNTGDLQVRAKETDGYKASDVISNTSAYTATLEGSVSLSGTAKYGETLTATVTGAQQGAVLTYTFCADDTVLQQGSSNTYKIVSAEAIGKQITVKVSAEGYIGTVNDTSDTVAKADGVLTLKQTEFTPTFGDEAFKLGCSRTGDGTISYKVSDEKVIKVSDTGEVTIVGAGSATVTVSLSETECYTGAAEQTIKVNVAKKDYVLNPSTGTAAYTYKQGASNVAVDVAGMLPADKGNTTYSVSTADAGTILENVSVDKNGNLTYNVKSFDNYTDGITATIAVTATMANYKDVTYTLTVKITDKFVVTEKAGAKVSSDSTSLVYGQKISALKLNTTEAKFVANGTEVAGKLSWETPNEVLNAGSHQVTWKFVPKNEALYQGCTGTITVTVSQATPNVTTVPTVADRVYHPTAALTDSDLVSGSVSWTVGGVEKTVEGSWSWKTNGTVPTTNVNSYVAVFNPTDTTNYVPVTKNITVRVVAATAYVAEKPTVSAITYGQTLSDATIAGGKVQYSENDTTLVDGTFSWKDASLAPNCADSNLTTYVLVFTPTDRANYNTVETDVTITVNKVKDAPHMPGSAMSVPYSNKTVGTVTLAKDWTWQESDKATALEVGVPVTATAVYNGADKGNYENESVVITITRSDCEHKNTEVRGEKESTCKEEGYSGDTYCKDCGECISTGHAIEKKEHSGGTATCTHKAKCSVCGAEYGTLNPNNHEAIKLVGKKDADCTSSGYTGDKCCSGCNAVLEKGKTIAATGHDYHSEITRQPTTTAEGERTYTCVNCNDTYTETIPKLPEEEHEHNYTCTITREATCTQTGIKTYTCKCGDSYTETIPKLNHKYTSSVTVEATKEKEGEMTYTCSLCGHSYTKPIAKLKDDNRPGDNKPGDNKPGNNKPGDNKPGEGGDKKPAEIPDTGKPFIKDETGKEGWDVIKNETSDAKDGDAVKVDMNGATVVPGDVLDTIAGKDVTIVFDMGNGITWSVNGNSITTDKVSDIDFSVKVGEEAGNNIPVDVINNVTGERYSIQISLAYDGEFGFTAVLSINMEAKNVGLYANLFYYNETTGELEFICADEIAEDGTADLTFTHASDYTIVIDEAPMDGNGADDSTGTGSNNVTTESKEDSWNPLWIIIIGAIVIVAGLGIFFIIKKKEDKEDKDNQ
ncbi:hypothetical protein LI172_04550 [Coprococcus catus]|uniref:hypothetical protein n=1 Tax=Coprococcus catus TaxID=116085 RepID=UPI001D05F849|nr:hypothetical protein [Coprococcus catus]MCB6491944.1 hypothetical protein [Coprococcus catus]